MRRKEEVCLLLLLGVILSLTAGLGPTAGPEEKGRPNILFCISDDQSALHVGASGDPVARTPGFDRVARRGFLFTHAFADAPSCTPPGGPS